MIYMSGTREREKNNVFIGLNSTRTLFFYLKYFFLVDFFQNVSKIKVFVLQTKFNSRYTNSCELISNAIEEQEQRAQ